MRRAHAHLGLGHPCIARRDQGGHDTDPTPTTNPDPHPHQADQREAKFSVKIIDDDRFEKAESFRVTLSEPSEGCELDTKGTIAMVRGLGVASMAGLGLGTTATTPPARDAAPVLSMRCLLTTHHACTPCCPVLHKPRPHRAQHCMWPTTPGRPSSMTNPHPSPNPTPR